MHRAAETERRGALGAHGRASATLAPVAWRVFLEIEDRALTDQRILLDLLTSPLSLLEHAQHALATRSGRAERAALDQRLDCLLVDRAVVHALAEVPDRSELPALRPCSLDRLHRLVAHALDRVQAEAD